MKKTLLIAAVVLLSSCSKGNYYQIYKTASVSGSQSAVYENADCRISYNFWSEGGDAGFTVFNKTSEPLTVQMDKSFYIVNGTAYDYFQARTFSTLRKESKVAYTGTYFYGLNLSSSVAAVNEFSTEYSERPEITIPANSSKSFREYKINQEYFAHCDLAKYPARRKEKTVTFTKGNSPFVFSNSITYNVNGKRNTLVHDFYVSEITNITSADEWKKAKIDNCGKQTDAYHRVDESKDNFYITYFKK